MKAILALVFFASQFGAIAFADEPVQVADHQCQDLQSMLQDQGKLFIRLRISRFYVYTREYLQQHRLTCSFDEEVVVNVVWSADTNSCLLGYRCEWRPRD